MKPVILSLPAFHAVGLEGTFTPSTIPEIPELWGRFVPQKASIPGRRGDVTFGFAQPNVPGPDGTPVFVYTAAVEVDSLDRVPEGLVGFTVPAATYARFTHTGPISGIGKTIDAIWGTWIPASALVPTRGLEFERYDERWDPATASGPVDIYIPVQVPDGAPGSVAGRLMPEPGPASGRAPTGPTRRDSEATVVLEAAPVGVVPICPQCKASLETIWTLVEGLGLWGQERILLCPHCRSFLGYNAWKR